MKLYILYLVCTTHLWSEQDEIIRIIFSMSYSFVDGVRYS